MCLKEGLQVLVYICQSLTKVETEGPQEEERKLQNEMILLKYDSDHLTIPQLPIPHSEERPEASPHSLEGPPWSPEGPTPAHCPQLRLPLPSQAPSYSLKSPNALTSGPLHLLIPMPEKLSLTAV